MDAVVSKQILILYRKNEVAFADIIEKCKSMEDMIQKLHLSISYCRTDNERDCIYNVISTAEKSLYGAHRSILKDIGNIQKLSSDLCGYAKRE